MAWEGGGSLVFLNPFKKTPEYCREIDRDRLHVPCLQFVIRHSCYSAVVRNLGNWKSNK